MSKLLHTFGSTSSDTTAKIRCPACGSYDCNVKDSRGSNNAVRRRRKCNSCGERFTTFETVEGLIPSQVFGQLRALKRSMELAIVKLDKFLDLECDHDGSDNVG
jgi:DNA-directed RNA polymerase subunit RPC12/RpoP